MQLDDDAADGEEDQPPGEGLDERGGQDDPLNTDEADEGVPSPGAPLPHVMPQCYVRWSNVLCNHLNYCYHCLYEDRQSISKLAPL